MAFAGIFFFISFSQMPSEARTLQEKEECELRDVNDEYSTKSIAIHIIIVS
jgi:hypothetical protein